MFYQHDWQLRTKYTSKTQQIENPKHPPEEAWLFELECQEKRNDINHGVVDNKRIAFSFTESRFRKLGLLKFDENEFPFNTKDQPYSSYLRLT